MDFEEYYQKFEAEAKKLLSAELWDKAVVDIEYPTGEWDKSTEIRNRAIDFAKDLFDSDAFNDAPEEAAEEFAEMVQEMDKEGAFDEGKCEDGHECKWHVEYELIDGDKEDETFDDETEAWSRFNELDARTKGGLADVLWVKEPTCPTCECGSSAASLGAVPNGGSQVKDEATDKDVEEFLSNALDNATIEDPNSGESYTLKFTADAGEFELTVLLPNGEHVALKSGPLFAVTDYYRELVEMDPEDAVVLIESTYGGTL